MNAISTGKKIELFRRAKGLTQTQLAEAAKLTFPTINRIENDLIDPKLGTLKQISEALDVDIQDIIGASVPRKKK